ncbi:uncharacterized protein [Spinacia oleracea]|uniref:Uncharacterized protein n=1 Tax=Spinacia oleracea TaxID=3562 RepID=A0ABM3RHC4_SPIOL|nr:uncharacterized protein LOC110793337 [Spinacia oleracea]
METILDVLNDLLSHHRIFRILSLSSRTSCHGYSSSSTSSILLPYLFSFFVILFRFSRSGEADDDSSQTFVFGSAESPSDNTSVTAVRVPVANIDSCSGEGTAKEGPGILLNILNLQSHAILDFGTPILDVKFLLQDKFSAKSSLDALLVDVPDVCSEVPCVDEESATSFSEQHDLVMIDNTDSTISKLLTASCGV